MKRIISLLLVAVMLCASLASCMPNLEKYAIRFADDKVAVSEDLMQDEGYISFLSKLTTFSARLTHSMSLDMGNDRNFCISPASIYMALAIASESAMGETRNEILSALGITYEEMNSFTQYLYSFINTEHLYSNAFGKQGTSGYGQLSNSIWIDSGLDYYMAGIYALTSKYNCDIYAASFRDGTAEKMINQYIEYKTHGLVTGDLGFSADTAFAIINTIYLKEIWNDLGKNLIYTLDSYDFVNSDTSVTKKQFLKGNYAEGVVLETMYYDAFYTETENGYRLYFVLPKGEKTVADVFTSYTISRLLAVKDFDHVDNANKQLHYTRLLFPEFSAGYNGDLSALLKDDFGVNSLFDKESCDFSNLIAGSVHCNSFVHKTKLSIKASGIEGSPVQSISGAVAPTPSEYETVYHDFMINRSFGFFLVDEYGTLLYSGVINNLN